MMIGGEEKKGTVGVVSAGEPRYHRDWKAGTRETGRNVTLPQKKRGDFYEL